MNTMMRNLQSLSIIQRVGYSVSRYYELCMAPRSVLANKMDKLSIRVEPRVAPVPLALLLGREFLYTQKYKHT